MITKPYNGKYAYIKKLLQLNESLFETHEVSIKPLQDQTSKQGQNHSITLAKQSEVQFKFDRLVFCVRMLRCHTKNHW